MNLIDSKHRSLLFIMFRLFLLIFATADSRNFAFSKSLSHVTENTTLIAEQIIDSKPYQITAFTKNSTNFKTTSFYKTLISKTPVVTVDSEINFDNQSLILSTISLSGKSNLLYVNQDFINPKEIQTILDKFTQLSRVKSRPKCLVSFRETLNDEESIKSTLRYGWSKKLLDMAVLNLRSGEVFSLNPFTGDYRHASTKEIFPKKLRDMKKYTVRSIFFDIPPYLYKIETGNTTKYAGMDYDFLEKLEKSFNFKLDFNLTKKTPEYDVYPGRHPLQTKFFKVAEIGQVVTFFEMCAIVANKKAFDVEMSVSKLVAKLLYIIATLLIIYLIHCILLVTKVDSKFFDYITTLLGQSVTKMPSHVVTNIILIVLGLYSMVFFPDVVAELTNLLVNTEEKSISTYKDVLDAKLQPYGS